MHIAPNSPTTLRMTLQHDHMTTTYSESTSTAPAPQPMTVKASTDSTTYTARLPAKPPPINTHYTKHTHIPPGSIITHITNAPSSLSPNIISDSPYDTTNLAHAQTTFADTTATPISNFATIIWIKSSPRVFGLHNDSQSSMRIQQCSSSLMDGGTNNCITGDILSMVSVVDIHLCHSGGYRCFQ
jgi:hypothetical protein